MIKLIWKWKFAILLALTLTVFYTSGGIESANEILLYGASFIIAAIGSLAELYLNIVKESNAN